MGHEGRGRIGSWAYTPSRVCVDGQGPMPAKCFSDFRFSRWRAPPSRASSGCLQQELACCDPRSKPQPKLGALCASRAGGPFRPLVAVGCRVGRWKQALAGEGRRDPVARPARQQANPSATASHVQKVAKWRKEALVCLARSVPRRSRAESHALPPGLLSTHAHNTTGKANPPLWSCLRLVIGRGASGGSSDAQQEASNQEAPIRAIFNPIVGGVRGGGLWAAHTD